MTAPAARVNRFLTRYRAFVTPTAEGLPRLRVILVFPAILLVLGAILVGLGWNGTSSGAYYGQVYSGTDPDLISGRPQAIRSDEWNTGTSWTISQLQQGLPERNETFPGGMDSTLPYDLPRLDWSVAFRPHLIGFLLFGADQGQAWRWWSSGFALIAAAYAFVVTMLPRRPILGAALAVGFFYSPFFQWWYQSTTFWPAVWALATMAALVWVLRSSKRRPRWVWAAIVGYLTAVMAMGIYIPYILAVAYVVAFFGIGLVIESLRRGSTWKRVLGAVGPIFAGGAAGALVTVIFLATRADTVEGFLSTVYPGARLTETGAAHARSFARVIGSSFSESLTNSGNFLGANSSEASTFFLVGIFLIPVIIWAIVQQRRACAVLPWPLIGLVAIVVVFAAYAFVPGWTAIAHLLFLDRIPIDNTRVGVVIALGIASLALLVAVIHYLDDANRSPGRVVAWTGAGLFLLSQVGIAGLVGLGSGFHALQAAAPYWWFFALMSTSALFFFARKRYTIGVVAFLLATVPTASGVNPVYDGIFDLRQTPVAREVISVDKAEPGTWVGIGNPLITATLVESGVRAYNGVQGAPSEVMWKEVDPAGRYHDMWDRIGFVNWTLGLGEPKVTNPSLDAVVVTFDACSDFAQKNVHYVLAEGTLDAKCLAVDERASSQLAKYTIYRVVAP
ncbi:MAG: hypothetical protein JWO18_1405 [Microbacteriaceae bacterium]|nr:hypothetical protein [Microbacteriaceae bacterium]